MARIRTIKPEFPQSESMGKVSREARLLFILLWPICDDHGRTRGASRMLASLLYPYDDDAKDLIEGWLDELERNGCVRRYIVDDTSYLDIPNWSKHQKIDRPSKSIFPPFVEGSRGLAKAREGSCEDQGPRTKEGIGTTTPPTPSPAAPGTPPPAGDAGGGGVAPKPKRRTRAQRLAPFRPETIAFVTRQDARWPKERPGNGSPVRNDVVAAAERVEVILAENPDVSLDLLDRAVDGWLALKPEFPNALQFWLGRDGPWKAEVRAQLTFDLQETS